MGRNDPVTPDHLDSITWSKFIDHSDGAITVSEPTDPMVPHSLDDYFQTTPIGSIERAIGDNIYGVNHRQVKSPVPSNKDLYGLTFFVRPQLNLQTPNVRNVRQLYPLLTENDRSVQRIVRCTLDPRLQYGYRDDNGELISPELECSLVDNLNAFVPMLTNNLLTISGWPDIVSPTFSSKEGLMAEIYSQVDGTIKNYQEFDIDATFRNTIGDPIIYLFYVWLNYQSSVFAGNLMPYIDYILENMIDYNTRIYRLVLDSQRRVVRKIAATGVSYPLTVPMGQFFDFNHDRPYNDQSKEFTIRFKCLGVIYQDDILVREFNQTVQIFNPDMKDDLREGTYYCVEPFLLPYFNHRGYPRINEETYVLEWWVKTDEYEARVQKLIETRLVDENLFGGGD